MRKIPVSIILEGEMLPFCFLFFLFPRALQCWSFCSLDLTLIGLDLVSTLLLVCVSLVASCVVD